MLTVNNQWDSGIIIARRPTSRADCNGPVTISAANNGVIGLIQNSFICEPVARGVFLLEDNGVGLQLEGGPAPRLWEDRSPFGTMSPASWRMVPVL